MTNPTEDLRAALAAAIDVHLGRNNPDPQELAHLARAARAIGNTSALDFAVQQARGRATSDPALNGGTALAALADVYTTAME